MKTLWLTTSIAIKSSFAAISTTLKASFVAVGGALKSVWAIILAHPIIAMAIGIVAIATLVIKNWTKVKELFSSFWVKIQSVWEKFSKFVKGFWKTISSPIESIGNAWNWITGGSGKQEENEDKIENAKKAKNEEATKIIKEAAGEPLKNATPTNSQKTQNNNYNITVNAENAEDPKSIAEEVRRAISEQDNGYLFDFAGVY